jgi:hypothetical protein
MDEHRVVPVPASELDALRRDAARWNLIVELTKHEIAELNPACKAIWNRFVKGGWWTNDLEQMIDAAIQENSKNAGRIF